MPLLPEPPVEQYVMGKKQWGLFVSHYRPVLLPNWPENVNGNRVLHFVDFEVYIDGGQVSVYTQVDLSWIYERYPH